MKFGNVQGSFVRMKVRYLNRILKQRILPQRIKKRIFPIRIDPTVNYLSSKQDMRQFRLIFFHITLNLQFSTSTSSRIDATGTATVRYEYFIQQIIIKIRYMSYKFSEKFNRTHTQTQKYVPQMQFSVGIRSKEEYCEIFW